MLAMKDSKGVVSASVSGLARFSAVTLEECREALRLMEGPDLDSKCSDDDGRKIQRVEGGWIVLGHDRFQEKMKEVSTKIGNAKRQQKHRDKQKASKPLAGEPEYVKASEDGAPPEVLDSIVDKHLPDERHD